MSDCLTVQASRGTFWQNSPIDVRLAMALAATTPIAVCGACC